MWVAGGGGSVGSVGSVVGRMGVAALVLGMCPAAGWCQAPGGNEPADRVRRPLAAPAPVNLVVRMGVGNHYTQGRPLPLRVTINNTGDAIDGQLTAALGGRRTGCRVKVPPGGRQEFLIVLPQDWVHLNGLTPPPIVLQLRVGRRVLATESLTPTPAKRLLIGAATGDGAGVQFLSGMQDVAVAHLAPAELPRQWAGLDPAECWIVTGRAWTSMDEDQRRALRMWVEFGGAAVLAGEKTAEWRDPEGVRLAGVLPEKEVGYRGLTAFMAWDCPPYEVRGASLLGLTGRPNPGVLGMLRQDGHPILVERRAGHGKVVWLGFDPFRAHLRESWPGYPHFITQLVERARRPVNETATHLDTRRLTDAVTAMPRLPGVPPWVVGVFGVLYVLVFGPLNVWVLRRLRRTVRAWLFVPGLALAMTIVLLLAGQSWGNARIVLNVVSVLRAQSGAQTAREDTFLGLFSPTNRSFEIVTEGAGPGLNAADNSEFNPWPTWQEEERNFWDALPMQLFSVRVLANSRPVDLSGVLEYEPTGPGEGRIRNRSRLRLTSATVREGDRVCRVADLPPGGSVEFGKEWRRMEIETFDQQKMAFGERLERLLSRTDPTTAPQGPVLVARLDGVQAGVAIAGAPVSAGAHLLELELLPGGRSR